MFACIILEKMCEEGGTKKMLFNNHPGGLWCMILWYGTVYSVQSTE